MARVGIKPPTHDAERLRRLISNPLHVLHEHLLTAAVVKLSPAVGVAGDSLSGFQGAVGVVELLRTGVFGLCHDGHAQCGNNRLSLTPRKELP